MAGSSIMVTTITFGGAAIAELVGTFILVYGGPAVAVGAILARPTAGPAYDSLAVALAFGLALAILAASPGHGPRAPGPPGRRPLRRAGRGARLRGSPGDRGGLHRPRLRGPRQPGGHPGDGRHRQVPLEVRPGLRRGANRGGGAGGGARLDPPRGA